jgi:hypothetical protein
VIPRNSFCGNEFRTRLCVRICFAEPEGDITTYNLLSACQQVGMQCLRPIRLEICHFTLRIKYCILMLEQIVNREWKRTNGHDISWQVCSFYIVFVKLASRVYTRHDTVRLSHRGQSFNFQHCRTLSVGVFREVVSVLGTSRPTI